MYTKKLQILGSLGGGASIQFKNITLPAGRAKGDINGNGSVDSDDASIILQCIAETRELSGIDLWAADMNGDGVITQEDSDILMNYYVENFDACSSYLSDYYENWVWDDVEYYYYYDASVDGITSSHSIVMLVDETAKCPVITKVECMNGLIRVYAESIPIVDVNCGLICKVSDDKSIVVGSQNMFDLSSKLDDTLTKESFAADAKATGDAIAELDSRVPVCLTQDEYDSLKASGQLNANTPYLIIEG